MGKRLTPSAGTGKKIIKNLADFKFSYNEIESEIDKGCVCFNWEFNGQVGYALIHLNDRIITGGTIGTTKGSIYDFKKTLSFYNDPTLLPVFEMMVGSIKMQNNK